MADMTPLTSVFNSANMILGRGFKITMEYLNKLANNTGFNWRGGRYPMREAFGVIEIDYEDLEVDTSGDIDVAIAVKKEVDISDRTAGTYRFSKGNSYQVFLTMTSPIDLDYDSDEDAILDAFNIDILSQTETSFEIRFDIPFPTDAPVGLSEDGNLRTQPYRILWFAKGW